VVLFGGRDYAHVMENLTAVGRALSPNPITDERRGPDGELPDLGIKDPTVQ
jgi:hypothetical protein